MTTIHDNYPKFMKEYTEIFQPLFEDAKKESEADFILSLLAIRGASDAGWEPFENTEDLANEVYKQQHKFKHDLRLNMNLWMYLQLIESSEQYELIANLLRTIKGEHYVVANHKNKHFVNLKVEQKIERLKKIATGTSHNNVSIPFVDTFDSKFRNAIGHGDYALKKSGEKGVTVIGDKDFPKLYNEQETSDLVNRALALHASISGLKNAYIRSYSEPIVLEAKKGVFGLNDNEDINVIVRKKHGVVGLSFIGGHDNGVPFVSSLYKCLPYEKKLIENGETYLPASKPEMINKFLALLPAGLASKVSPKLTNYINRGSDG